MLQKVRAKQVESWSKANGANVVVGEIPAGTVASSEPSHRIKKEDLRKQQHARLRRKSITSLHETVGQMQRERIDQFLRDIKQFSKVPFSKIQIILQG